MKKKPIEEPDSKHWKTKVSLRRLLGLKSVSIVRQSEKNKSSNSTNLERSEKTPLEPRPFYNSMAGP